MRRMFGFGIIFVVIITMLSGCWSDQIFDLDKAEVQTTIEQMYTYLEECDTLAAGEYIEDNARIYVTTGGFMWQFSEQDYLKMWHYAIFPFKDNGVDVRIDVHLDSITKIEDNTAKATGYINQVLAQDGISLIIKIDIEHTLEKSEDEWVLTGIIEIWGEETNQEDVI